jgi:Domain of unknown function (DUF4112)
VPRKGIGDRPPPYYSGATGRPPLKEAEWELLPPGEKSKRHGLEPLFRWLAIIMDGLLRLPGTKFRFGLNPLIDFIPVVGDVSVAFVSASVLVYAVTRGLPKVLLARMALNVALNELVGVVPVVGSLFAFWFRANKRNYNLLQEHIARPGRSGKSDWAFIIGLLALLFVIFVSGLIVTFVLLHAFAKFLSTH